MRGRGRAAALLVLAALASSCAKEGPPPVMRPREGPVALPVDEVGPRVLLAEQRDAVRRRDADGFVRSWAEDGFFLGPTAQSALEGRAAIRARLAALLGALPPVSVQVAEHGFGLTGDGRGAWAFQELTLAPREGASVTYRVSTALTRGREGWRIVAQAWTLPVPNEAALAAAERFPAPRALEESGAGACAEVVSDLRSWRECGEPMGEAWVGSLSVGTAREEVAPTDEAMLARWREGLESGALRIRALAGGIRCRDHGSVVVSAFNETLELGPEGGRTALPVRVFVVHVESEGVVLPVHWHVALPLPERERAAPSAPPTEARP